MSSKSHHKPFSPMRLQHHDKLNSRMTMSYANPMTSTIKRPPFMSKTNMRCNCDAQNLKRWRFTSKNVMT
ncbi:hypothetical protein EUGRSUZ_B02665 [Eucalyptus grandis]|uniref:Uncharacterized protein n=2 Tax=Eucalyptus grandis TaxID=71139 RepID=A0ACC3LUD9_EUCGR|nr:hypothetical protein EUGRSUZ_B02665 [Eucalyptus grandis]